MTSERGYSTLPALVQLDLDELKIDRSLVQAFTDDPKAKAVIHGISTIATGIGAGAVAEGVETNDQADRLANLGSRSAQSYLFGRPAWIDTPPVRAAVHPDQPGSARHAAGAGSHVLPELAVPRAVCAP